MRVLITGIAGFVGGYLTEHLLAATPGANMFGLRLPGAAEDEGATIPPVVQMVDGDLLDAPSLERAVRAARPDVVFHLAAASSVAGSWISPTEIFQVNVVGTVNLLDAVRQLAGDATVVLACSGESYGQAAPEEVPLHEDRALRPVSPYAVSKATVDMLGFQYHHAFQLRTVRLRLFNHCGPRQSDRFVVSALARQVAEIEAGLRPPELRVGNLDARRDFLDVRDVARAYLLAATAGLPGEVYNVASGTARSIREVVNLLLSMTEAAVEVSLDSERLRPTDIAVLAGDTARFRSATGWAPRIPFDRTLLDCLRYWRARVASA